MKGPIAVTGATGFIGRCLVGRLLQEGWSVRVLARRQVPALEQLEVTVVRGSLEDEPALDALVGDAVAVIHCAGAIRATDRRSFERVNAGGTADVAAATARAAAKARLLLVSSLAARQPELSAYGASKRAGEEAALRHRDAIELCVLRPPAVYGPGDRATLPIFRQLSRGLLLAPAVPGARFSLLYVDDLTELMLRLLELPRWDGLVIEPDDGRDGGYGWSELAEIAAGALGRPVRLLPLSRHWLWMPSAVAELAGKVMRKAPGLSTGKLRELYHPDWVCRRDMPAAVDWRARTSFDAGFVRTLSWYRQHGWLPTS